jgi:dTDP-D-glucose 4,6-dehydratase
VRGIFNLLIWGTPSETYHIVGPEISNLQVINTVAKVLNRKINLHQVQPGPSHDMRYSIRDTKISTIAYDIEDTDCQMQQTIAWYKENQSWLQ